MTARTDTVPRATGGQDAPRDAERAAAIAGEVAFAAPAPRRPLRLGLLLDDTTAPRWVERVLRRLVEEGVAEIALVVLNDAGEPPPAMARRSLPQRLGTWYRNRQVLGYALYQRLDERRYPLTDSPFQAADLGPLLADATTVRVRPRMTKFCDYFEDADLARIAEHDVDVALRFGFRIIKGGALHIARHGVWSFHHGDNTVNRGGPAGFWEVMEQHEVTGAVLQRLTEDLDGGEIIARSYSSTDRFSTTVNRANYYWQASELLVTELRALSARLRAAADAPANGPSPEPPPAARPWSAYSHRLYTKPRTGEVLRHGLRLGARLVRAKLRSLVVREQWLLAYRLSRARGPEGDVPDGVFYRFRELEPPADRFWADPFPVVADGRHFVFFEEFPYAAPHAHISVLEVDAKGVPGEPRVVLQRPYHLSYPAVFSWQGEWYMTPETFDRRTVELYRATRFPDAWELVGDLLTDVAAVDATIAEIDGRWWMFAGIVLPGATEATALHLYSAPTPLGPWLPHRRNPVKVDVRGARPGGRVFTHGGRHYRVGQDGAPSYGSGLRVFVIDRLDDDVFQETEVERIAPRWRPGLVGMHTLNAQGGLTVIDIRQVRRRF